MRSSLLWLSMIAGLLGVNTLGYAGSANARFDFTATFVGGTCDISAPRSVSFNGGNALLAADIEQHDGSTTETFTLTLSGCDGWGMTPSIKVSGQTTTDFSDDPLFLNPPSVSEANGYGLLLSTAGNSTFESNENLAKSPTILAKNWSTSTELKPNLDTSLPMTAQLSCGSCSFPGRHGGAFSATVTFEFVYE
ncbi:fimbrial protein [Providencia stuartii]|uniref:fimbrial protein n=1 Tax=Providencia stuartii TaxID=588 RepID=UPI00300D354A